MGNTASMWRRRRPVCVLTAAWGAPTVAGAEWEAASDRGPQVGYRGGAAVGLDTTAIITGAGHGADL